ncbi:SH3 domain-containing protein [Methyloligella sp. 2.7D]|uniref:SH3 domain-containing protein n=1 Tax=unclassified Methyloligella TaxID=2625955 RepID=UPI00157C28EF|nr:SH3 domain-containing protein [Methyloligella sp. GL2]QKP77844.1 SH3 domain-containing protein [Methyloligella sp. GL2]
MRRFIRQTPIRVRPLRKAALFAAMLLAGLGLAGAPAHAWTAYTTADLNLRQGPSTGYPIIATMPNGSKVDVGGCSGGWCEVGWRGTQGFAAASMLAEAGKRGRAPEVVVIDPRYPWHAGHYATADDYFDLPPYAAEPPHFYRRRFLLSPRERNRYRYRPHIFSPAEAAAAYN